jgi:ABC-type branched-subunit amino acid transport system substrate-binding protein
LPSFFDQARTLVDFAVNRQVKGAARPKLAAVYSGGGFEQDALAGLQRQAKAYALELSEHHFVEGHLTATELVSVLFDERPDYLFFFGSGNDLLAFAGEMERRGLKVPLLTCAAMLAEAPFRLPDAIAAQSYLSYPASLPDDDDLVEFLTMMRRAGVPLKSGPLQALAYAGASVLVAAAREAGRHLSRSSLVSSLESLQNFRTGVLSPISFSPNRRIGSTDSYIVSIDVVRKKYLRASNRISPSH